MNFHPSELDEKLLWHVFQHIHHALIILRKEMDHGEIVFRAVYVNSQTKKTFGLEDKQLLSKTLFEIFPRLGKWKKQIYESIFKVLNENKIFRFDSVKYSDERIKPSYYNIQFFKLKDDIVGMTIENISRRKVVELAGERNKKLLETIAKAMQELLMAKNKIEGLQKAISVFGKELDLQRVCILQVHPHPETGEDAISLRYEWAAEGIRPIINDPDEQNMKVKQFGAEPFLCMLKEGKIIHSSDNIGNETLQRKFKRKNLGTHQIVPIFVKDKLWGFFSILAEYETDWSRLNESGLLTLASGIGSAIMHHEEERKLIESETKFADLVYNVPGVIYQWVHYKDGSEAFTYISPKIEEIFEIEEKKVMNNIRYFTNCIHKVDQKEIFRSVKNAVGNLTPWSFKGRFITPSGKIKWFHAIARPTKVENGNVYFNGILLDITKQVESEREVKRYEQMMEGVALANTELIQTDDYDQAIKNALNIFAKHAKYQSILIYKRINEEKFPFLLKNVYHNDMDNEDHEKTIENEIILVDKFNIARKLYNGEIMEIKMGDLSEKMQNMLKKFDVTAVLLIPIFVHGEFWGIISIDNLNNRYGWTHMEKKALQSLASSIGGTLMRQMTEQDLIKSQKEAIKANQAKSQFLAAMSHEIRTPLNAIIGMADLLIDTELTKAQEQYVNIFRKSGESLMSIINAILDLSKIESGQMALVNEPFNLRKLIESSSDVFALSAQRKGLEFMYDLSPDLPTYVIGDADRLRQILANIVGNAIKFTKEGEITVRAHPYQGDRTGNILFAIQDTGIGIPKHKIAQIFDEFVQVDSSTTKQYGGTGLGLTISRKLVQMMGGEIWAESEVGKGTTFYFTVSLQIENESTFKETITSIPSLAGLKVLIVDDNSTNRLILKKMLEPLNVDIDDVDSGRSALEVIEKKISENHPYELILLDGVMPDMSGIEVAKVICEKWGLTDITIMMLTSDYTSNELNELKALGIHSFLIKPIKQDELYASILKAVSETQHKIDEKKRKALLKFVSSLQETAPHLRQEEANKETKTLLLVEDSPDNRLLITAYLKNENYIIDIAENGAEAVEKFKQKRYDIVLMDMQMPVMDGYTATRRIRLWEQKKNIPPTPIIALTAYALSEDMKKSLEAGCDVHISKPVKKQKLLEVLKQFL